MLKGSIIFLADLVRAMPIPLSIDLMEVSSYGASTESSGQVRILKDLSTSISGREVIVVEDIIDTGLTLNYLLRYLHDKGPRRSASAACSTSRLVAWPRSRSTTAASRSRTDSSSATAWTTASAIETCRTSASSAHRSTARHLRSSRMADGAPGGRYRFPILLGSLLMVGRRIPDLVAGRGRGGQRRIDPGQRGDRPGGPGIVVYGAALAALVLLDIGYMRGRWGFVLDAPWVYLALGVIASAALAYRIWELWSVGFVPLPQRSPGLAAAALGIGLVLYGAGRGLAARRA